MKRHRAIAVTRILPILCAMLVVMVSLLAGAVPVEAKSRYYNKHHQYEVQCRTGWWMVRDGHRHWRPSDGMWRPTWETRCFKVRVPHHH